MNEETEYLIRRLSWLCGELLAGNEFSPATLRRLEAGARRELEANEARKAELGMKAERAPCG